MPKKTGSGVDRAFRTVVDAFIEDRLNTKIEKLAEDDPVRAQRIAEYQRDTWIQNASVRVKRIHAASHLIKGIHSGARGTNLYVTPSELVSHELLGSHALGDDFAMDVTGDAAALDVYKLLKLEVEGRTLLKALLADDADALYALNEDPDVAQALASAFISLIALHDEVSSHGLGKQLYWLTGDDATDDAQYLLVAPLFPTSLVHAIHAEVQDARFGSANKAARQARRDRSHHDGVNREYPGVAVRKLGGSNQQNVSQLNSERDGHNYLFSTAPPEWEGERRRLPVDVKSVFERHFASRPRARRILSALQTFLARNPPRNVGTRERVRSYVAGLVADLAQYARDLAQQPAGWTRRAAFDKLAEEEKLWLDPSRGDLPGEEIFAGRWEYMDWPAQVAQRFGEWLNVQLGGRLPEVGQAEAREWRRAMLNERNACVQDLRALRIERHTPSYVPFRKTHAELMAHKEGK